MKLYLLTGALALGTAACGAALYVANQTPSRAGGGTGPMAQSPVVLTLDVAPAPATQPAVDVGNTKCVVMGDAIEGAGATLTYEGKIYHFCCGECIPTFQKDPAKYIQALEKDPAKFGVKK